MACPRDWITYNSTLCHCGVGQVLNRSSNTCHTFGVASSIVTDAGVDSYAISFPGTIFSFDSIRKFTQSQAIFLEATLVALLSWLLFCCALRLKKLPDGRSLYFNLRWWISRLDITFSTRHWLDDQQVVKKRKTELGGTFSIASWILFAGLFAALLYQFITKRTIEIHNVRATNGPDLASFINDIEFNITIVSSMSCSNLRGIGNLITGNPGLDGYKRASLKNFANYSCQNTTMGPTINFECSSCRLLNDYMYISWHFVDLPKNPAAAVGFQFNFTTKSWGNNKHIKYVGGTLRNGSVHGDRSVTFRGTATNILKFHLMPQIYHNLHDLKLIQPLFHDFVPGSNYGDKNQLQASLNRASDGLVNTTVFLNYLSAYVVEVDNRSVMGPVSFLADLGGLYCISVGIFFYLLVQCEYRIKGLRNEDGILRKIRSRRKAQERWDKLRKYVTYTWGCNLLDDDHSKTGKRSYILGSLACSEGSCFGRGSFVKESKQHKADSVSLNKKNMRLSEKHVVAKEKKSQKVKSCEAAYSAQSRGNNRTHSMPLNFHGGGLTNHGIKCSGSPRGERSQPKSYPGDNKLIPLPPPVDFKVASAEEVEKKFQILYDYNLLLREKLLANQSMLDALAAKLLSPQAEIGNQVS